jgi:hypothetical protein
MKAIPILIALLISSCNPVKPDYRAELIGSWSDTTFTYTFYKSTKFQIQQRVDGVTIDALRDAFWEATDDSLYMYYECIWSGWQYVEVVRMYEIKGDTLILNGALKLIQKKE